MIAHLKGIIEEKFGNNGIIIDVCGVGYEMAVPTPDFEAANLGEEKKNNEELYGFGSLAAKRIFELLISVQGVGPKAAIAILSLAEAETVRNAIANADTGFVAKASGVGKKTAERVIVDLRDKVGIPSKYGAADNGVNPMTPANDEALDALMALGFSLKEATAALEKVDAGLSTEEKIKMALKK